MELKTSFEKGLTGFSRLMGCLATAKHCVQYRYLLMESSSGGKWYIKHELKDLIGEVFFVLYLTKDQVRFVYLF